MHAIYSKDTKNVFTQKVNTITIWYIFIVVMYNVDRVYQRNCLCYKSVVSPWYGFIYIPMVCCKLQMISLDSVVSRNQIHPLNIIKSVMLSSNLALM